MTNFAISRNIEKIPQVLSIFWNQNEANINSKKLIKLALAEAFFKYKKI